ncbi:hypothetical protein G7Z17_g5935 [Cylindrodendrum hubeiense]|uniref:Uncharacterized protein n=1 Tax=Cylindrodendrum hubeiense TaxID=595255 RepID=A0A9P5LFP2_9HYPO|nr:hypothetical protein G7Z17_g5935 [Cylindrodendrum hubeiense]
MKMEQLTPKAQPPQPPPFSGCLLESIPHQDGDADANGDNHHRQNHLLFPASYLTLTDDIAIPHPDAPDSAVDDELDRELDLERLTKVRRWLWLVGRPNPPRPLHRQLALGRDIVIDERMDMHLVWTAGRMFLKPLPRFLLCSDFWSRCLACHNPPTKECQCDPSKPKVRDFDQEDPCKRQRNRQRALGFLFSYITLIRYESDFHIAKEHHLLPKEVTWPTWSRLVREVIAIEHLYQHIHPRFVYGELRLSRLNKIYRLSWPLFMSGYIRVWQRYDDFWHQSFALLTSVTVYIAIVLTAMQVGLATTELGGNRAFQAAAYGFTVFSILGPLIFGSMALILFFLMLIDNWITTKANLHKRMNIIQVKV